MGIPITLSISLAAADDNGISETQTPLGAGNLLINGALATAGVATLTTGLTARQVIITSAGNDLARTFTIYGTDAEGNAISEALAGASGAAATSVKNYKTVTRIAVDGATAAGVIAGTNGVGSTKAVNVDYYMDPFAIGIGCVVVGTINYTVQHTFADYYNTTPDAFAAAAWFPNTGITSKSANTDGNYAFPVSAVRVTQNSGSGSVSMTFIQATTSP